MNHFDLTKYTEHFLTESIVNIKRSQNLSSKKYFPTSKDKRLYSAFFWIESMSPTARPIWKVYQKYIHYKTYIQILRLDKIFCTDSWRQLNKASLVIWGSWENVLKIYFWREQQVSKLPESRSILCEKFWRMRRRKIIVLQLFLWRVVYLFIFESQALRP